MQKCLGVPISDILRAPTRPFPDWFGIVRLGTWPWCRRPLVSVTMCFAAVRGCNAAPARARSRLEDP